MSVCKLYQDHKLDHVCLLLTTYLQGTVVVGQPLVNICLDNEGQHNDLLQYSFTGTCTSSFELRPQLAGRQGTYTTRGRFQFMRTAALLELLKGSMERILVINSSSPILNLISQVDAKFSSDKFT